MNFQQINKGGKKYFWRVVGNRNGVYVEIKYYTSTTSIRVKSEIGKYHERIARELLAYLFTEKK